MYQNLFFHHRVVLRRTSSLSCLQAVMRLLNKCQNLDAPLRPQICITVVIHHISAFFWVYNKGKKRASWIGIRGVYLILCLITEQTLKESPTTFQAEKGLFSRFLFLPSLRQCLQSLDKCRPDV